MSSEAVPVLTLDRVWKRYRLGSFRGGVTRRRRLARELSTTIERWKERRAPYPVDRHVWALVDASFSVERGEAVGLIGPNGSGKSTALKLISRITQPWSGTVRSTGRIGSLIEVRSGIHPELTGRENIYLYGAILGLRRREIRRRFDAMVEFAELGRFIDIPVKRYSSGMEVRLGFSVAVHLEPDVLLVDEVLSVGDEEFQGRCLRRMDEVRTGGQTLLFVSHVLADVKRLCPRTIYLDRGSVRFDGPSSDAIALYLRDVEERHGDLP